jgi:predicted nuclease of restriction endonuclease-like (RecB) superfamily
MKTPLKRLRITSSSLTKPMKEFAGYAHLIQEISQVLNVGKRAAAWSLNGIMSAIYWDIGRRIVEFEQAGREKANYGERLIDLLAADLQKRFGRGFGRRNLFQIRAFYLSYRSIVQTPSAQLGKVQTPSAQFNSSGATLSASKAGTSPRKSRKLPKTFDADHLARLTRAFPLPWSHYVRLLAIEDSVARKFYEAEALRGGWSHRELVRQVSSQLYERLALSKNKAAVLQKERAIGEKNLATIDEELRDPFILEFLDLKDEYSESDLEDALIEHLGQFLVELGNEFCFVARQRRLRVGGEWYRVDLLFIHRKLRCLVVIDLKIGKFTPADAGQMHLYCNYARQHWTRPEENPPVGLILCAEKDEAVARYALEGLPNKVLAREYRLVLPDEKLLAAEIEKTRDQLERRSVK